MTPPYDEFAVRSLGGFMILSRSLPTGEDGVANNVMRASALRLCVERAMAELGLPRGDYDTRYMCTVLLDLSLLSIDLVGEAHVQE